MGTSRNGRRLPKRTQRGGREFNVTDAHAEIISEYATLFIDRVPEALVSEAIRVVIEAFGVPDSPLLTRLTDATAKNILKAIRSRLGDKVEELVRDRAPIITKLSGDLCRILPGCNSETVSAEVAKRLDTTIEGAHAWLVRPLLFSPGPATNFALEVLRIEARSACLQRGTADDLRQFYRGTAFLTGAPMFGDALDAINRGCKE